MSIILEQIVKVDWAKNLSSANNSSKLFEKAEESQIKLACWCKQIENIYIGNTALPFIREAQVSSQDFFCLLSLGVYKASASSLRTILESFLYFSYFKDHSVELRTLSEDSTYYTTKREILDYHNIHTIDFKNKASNTGFKKEVEDFYSKISAIVHGQKPGIWHSSSSLANKCFNPKIAEEAINDFVILIDLINVLLLIIVSDEDWMNIPIKSRQIFTKGMKKEKKDLLNRH